MHPNKLTDRERLERQSQRAQAHYRREHPDYEAEQRIQNPVINSRIKADPIHGPYLDAIRRAHIAIKEFLNALSPLHYQTYLRYMRSNDPVPADLLEFLLDANDEDLDINVDLSEALYFALANKQVRYYFIQLYNQDLRDLFVFSRQRNRELLQCVLASRYTHVKTVVV